MAKKIQNNRSEKGASFVEVTAITALGIVIGVGVWTLVGPNLSSSSAFVSQGETPRLAAVASGPAIVQLEEDGTAQLKSNGAVNNELTKMLDKMLSDFSGKLSATAMVFVPQGVANSICRGLVQKPICVGRAGGGLTVPCIPGSIGEAACETKMRALATANNCATFVQVCVVSLNNPADSTLIQPAIELEIVKGQSDPSTGGGATPTPGASSTPTATIIPPTITPTYSPSPSPTLSPTATPTVSPTVSVSPSPSPSVSPSASPSPSPSVSPSRSPTPPITGGHKTQMEEPILEEPMRTPGHGHGEVSQRPGEGGGGPF